MQYTVKYYCPKHRNELLATEQVDDSLMKMFQLERPLTCRKCKKNYTRAECIADRYDDEN